MILKNCCKSRSNIQQPNLNQSFRRNVPENYKILLLHGGGQGLFAAVPLNLMSTNGVADYAVAGIWSKIAANEAKKYGQVNLVFPEPNPAGVIPEEKSWKLSPNASYVYYCDNETIQGCQIGLF